MLKIICNTCKKHDVFENEKHAYMAGWFWVGPRLNITLCYRCGTHKDAVSKTFNASRERGEVYDYQDQH
jgi:hypothetical protein